MVKCASCGNALTEIKKKYYWKDLFFNEKVDIGEIEYERCNNCNEDYFPPTAVASIEKAIREKMNTILESRPIRDFWSIKETYTYLNVSKQAFSKSPHIYNCLIFNIKKDNRRFYLKESVILFKEKKDGRFVLDKAINTAE